MKTKHHKKPVLMGLAGSVIILLAYLAAGCRQTDPWVASGPFYGGFDNLPWGSRLSALDSAMMTDTSIQLVSRIPNLKSKGMTNIIRSGGQEFYLDYNENNRLASFNYFSVNDTLHELDSLRFHLSAHYGEPLLHVQPNYTRQEWKVPHEEADLTIRLIAAGQRYSVTAFHHLYAKPHDESGQTF